jgi:hypothetical protein
MLRHRPALGLGGSFADVHSTSELALTVERRVTSWPPCGVAAAQVGTELLS